MTLTLSVIKFMKRLILHIHPKNFKAIRRYGFTLGILFLTLNPLLPPSQFGLLRELIYIIFKSILRSKEMTRRRYSMEEKERILEEVKLAKNRRAWQLSII